MDKAAVTNLVIREFTNSFKSAREKGMSDIAPAEVATHRLLTDTLRDIDGSLSSVDDVSAALSKRADDLHALAEINRNSPSWGDVCVAMGAVRNAAVAVWHL